MSSDPELERLLKDARETLPEPGPEASRRARARALAAGRQRRPRRLRAVVLVAVVVVSVALGVVGALIAPSGTAARAIGLGFLPEPGWHALQAATPATPSQPQVAMSANVPFAADDAVLGLAEPSGLPYSTLLTLPAKGIVIVATFTEETSFSLPAASVRLLYPERRTPLRMEDATPITFGTQVRPEEPLGQYQLRATIERWSVDVHIYFGTPTPSAPLRAEAQAQLERLVVRRGRVAAPARSRPAATPHASAPAVLDRTVACRPTLIGGIRQIDALAHAGSGRSGANWARPAFAGIRTTYSGAAATAIDEHLVWVSAGRPSAHAVVPGSFGFVDFPYRLWGTVAINRVLCRTVKTRVALSPRGLQRASVGPLEERWDCETPRVVLVRVRAVLRSGSALRSYRNFVRTAVPAMEATVVVQTQSGRRLAFARVLEAGRALLYTAPSCLPD